MASRVRPRDTLVTLLGKEMPTTRPSRTCPQLAHELDADLVLGLYDQNYGPVLEKLEQQPLFQVIPAVKEDGIVDYLVI